MEPDLKEPTQEPDPAPPARGGPSALALTAIVLSLSALFVSIFELSAIRTEQRVQVWPYVEVEASYGPEGFAVTAANKGVGPARVRSSVLTFDGEPVADLDALILETLGPEDAFSYDLYRTRDISRSVLSADEEATLFGVPWENRTRRLTELWGERISAEVCYCSVYDECWVAEVADGDPMPVPMCEAARR